MKSTPQTEIDRALHDADRVTGWNFRTVPVRRFRLGTCTLIVIPARTFAEHRTPAPAAATATHWRECWQPHGDAA
ncbi:MAG TPA: hypothetical protein VF292_07510 [Rhodanobacteraceae bacterium]